MAKDVTRRDFLRLSGAATLTLGLARLDFTRAGLGSAALAATEGAQINYRSWEDVYRQKWAWDRIAHGTHTMTNCVSGCAWNLYVKDDTVWREEQQSPYKASAAGLPDFNPRGCQKGACAATLMHSPSRVRYPLRRVGERGAGRWERVSWDEALSTVAKGVVDALQEEGPASILCEL